MNPYQVLCSLSFSGITLKSAGEKTSKSAGETTSKSAGETLLCSPSSPTSLLHEDPPQSGLFHGNTLQSGSSNILYIRRSNSLSMKSVSVFLFSFCFCVQRVNGHVLRCTKRKYILKIRKLKS